MGTIKNDRREDEYSIIEDKGEMVFIDFEDLSASTYAADTEGPIVISMPFPFARGKPQSILVGEASKCAITLENTTHEPVELWGVRIFCSNPTDSFTLSLIEPVSEACVVEKLRGFLEAYSLEDRVLQPRQTLTVWLSCKPKGTGLHTSVVHFDVGDDRIERVAFLLAEDRVSQSLLPCDRAASSSKTTPSKNHFSVDHHVPHSRVSAAKSVNFKYHLPEFPIPRDIRELLENKKVPVALSEGLCRRNYADFFTTLLIMEEIHLEKGMRCHNLEKVSMRLKGIQLLALDIPGLGEKRPSLVRGDYVSVKLVSDTPNDIVYQGCIFSVEEEEVLLKFSKAFHSKHQNGNLYDAQFSFNRVNMRRLYQAVHAADNLDDDLLFPSSPTTRRGRRAMKYDDNFVPFARNLNREQVQSVKMILGCTGAPPLLIYGPPGTGKTKTLVEAILQVYATIRASRILVCAASNSAADHVLEKLIDNDAVKVKENEVFRLNASSRAYEDVPSNHVRFCFFIESIFRCPPVKALMRYRIIICTYMSSSLLYAEGIGRGHFSHVFLDEAGQASEPETMVPLSYLSQRETVVVLAGDPKQLGPVIFCREAEASGLAKSFLERLFESDFYSREENDDHFIVKLVKNYRSHPSILHLPSQLFYDGKLLPCKKEASLLSADVSFLPSTDFPLLFYGIQGCDERKGNNPSWFNRIEVSKVVDIICKLRENQNLREADIGVISPYQQQVCKIKRVLEIQDMPNVKVGSVEQFQGQEREVIIVSMVRSSAKHSAFDRSLGFLGNPKRFNVVITRARSLLVLVGNPHVICKDPYWNRLLWYCAENNSYRGCSLPRRDTSARFMSRARRVP